MIVIIMAGGRGTRMKSDLPKVLHRVAGKPMICHVVDTARALRPDRILVVVGENREEISEVLDDDLILVDQPNPQGTGHAIQCCLPYLDSGNQVIVLSGDMPLIGTVLDDLVNYENAMVATDLEDTRGYGRVICMFGKGYQIIEEKDCDEVQKMCRTVNCGVYSFSSDNLLELAPGLSNDNAQNEYYITDIVNMIPVMEIVELPAEEQYQVLGVNTQEQLREVEDIMMSK